MCVNNQYCLNPNATLYTLSGVNLAQRIRDARGKRTQTALAKRVRELPGGGSFTQQMVSELENEGADRSAYICHIAVAAGVNPEWLAIGTGDPDKFYKPQDFGLNDTQLAGLATALRALNETQRKRVLLYAATLYEEHRVEEEENAASVRKALGGNV